MLLAPGVESSRRKGGHKEQNWQEGCDEWLRGKWEGWGGGDWEF